MEESKLKDLSKKNLYYLSEKLLNSYDGENWINSNSPYDDITGLYDELKTTLRVFGITEVSNLDVEFMFKFININHNLIQKISDGDKSLINSLVIPTPKLYYVYYDVWGSCTFNEEYRVKTSSYDKEWAISLLGTEYSDGNFDLYSGEQLNVDYDNWEIDNYEFLAVDEVNQPIKTENLLSRIVVENTEDVVNSLDKKTLLKLKSIIDSRLRLL